MKSQKKQIIVKMTQKPIFSIVTSSNIIILKSVILQSCASYQIELKNIFSVFLKNLQQTFSHTD